MPLAALLAASALWAAEYPPGCAKDESAATIESKELPFHQTLDEIRQRFEWLATSGKRLAHRGHRREGRYVVPFVEGGEGEFIELPETFLSAVRGQIEAAIELGHARYPFYSDMGHVHLFLSAASYARLGRLYKERGLSKRETLEELLRDPALKLLYHASEQLIVPPDPRAQEEPTRSMRRRRNLLGAVADPRRVDVLPEIDGPNTHRSVPDMERGPTVYFSASPKGCLPMRLAGREFFLDFSLAAFAD